MVLKKANNALKTINKVVRQLAECCELDSLHPRRGEIGLALLF